MDNLLLATQAARAAPSADNAQPWQLKWDSTRLSVHFCQRHELDPFGPGGHATLLSIGALAENLAQALSTSAGDICFHDLARGAPYFSLLINKTTVSGDISALPLFQRQTNRHPFKSQPPPSTLISEICSLAEPETSLIPLSNPNQRYRFSEIALACCKARFCNRELHEWLMGSLRVSEFEVKSGHGLDLATLHLPPGGKQFLKMIRPWQRMALFNRFGAYRFMALTEIQPLRRGPLILTITGPDSPEGTFAAGRSMERTWIRLNQLGWAVHPYYVIADQQTRLLTGRLPVEWTAPVTDALSQLDEMLDIKSGKRLHMAFRVGRPTREPVRSRRLPLESIFTNITT